MLQSCSLPRSFVVVDALGYYLEGFGMPSGDHKATAIAIAKECGILRRGIDYRDDPSLALVHRYTAMTGED
eukprot:4156050-Amphidinium_carterae.1